MKHSSYTNKNTYCDYYTLNNVRTDGQGSYFGDKLYNINNNRFWFITLCHNPELWQSFPAEKQHKLKSSLKFTAIKQELKALFLDLKDDTAIIDQQKELRTEKRKLIVKELRKC
jgi:hypothetical protein